MNNFRDVDAFHEKFGLPRGFVVAFMDPEIYQFRTNFLWEELNEFEEACGAGNLVGAADALCDFVYVACGTALFMGCPRAGAVGDWPSFHEVRNSALTYRVVLPGHQPPHLLPPNLFNFAVSILRMRLQAFELAYHAAVADEPGAILEMALHSLKMCTNSAFTVASLMHLPWEACWRHVQDANMTKQRAKPDGSDSKRKSSFDVVKPTGWKAPDAKIAMELQLAGWRIPDFLEVDNATGKVHCVDRVAIR